MILTIDVGNSHIHAGLFDSNNLVLQFRYTTISAYGSSDQIGIFFKQAIVENKFDPLKIKGVAISSVVPGINYSLRSAILKYFFIEPFFLSTKMKTDLKIKVKSPESVGIDRIAGCVSAINLFPDKDILIIDLGTATVFDVVKSDKSYLSGAILPGVKISFDSLSKKAAQLSSVSIIKPRKVIGDDIDTNLQSGIYYGHLGALKELKKSIIQELNLKNKNSINLFTIATGGFAHLFDVDNLFDMVIPELVLSGIKISYMKNHL